MVFTQLREREREKEGIVVVTVADVLAEAFPRIIHNTILLVVC